MQKSHVVIAALIGILAVGAPPVIGSQEAQKQKAAGNAAPRPEVPPGQPVNIKVDLTITDQIGSGDPLRKIVTMVVADRGTGSIRSLGTVRSQGRVQINVDARPQILQSGGIRISLGLEYNPRTLGNDAPAEWSSLNEQIQAVLEPGKPLVISQAADPASDRKIMVEVRASILK
jgi:hypothetical protein